MSEVNFSSKDYKYIDDLPGEIEKLKKSIEEKTNELEENQKFIRNSKGFAIPYRYGNDYNVQYLDNRANISWDSYKNSLYRCWRGVKPRNTCITNTFSIFIYYTWMVLTVAFIIITNILGWRNVLKINLVAYIASIFLISEIISGAVSIWYYILRPNSINRYYMRLNIKKLKSELKLDTNNLKTKENMLEAYRLSTIDPNKEFSKAKINTIERLKESVKYSRENILEGLPRFTKDKYSKILEKADSLLELAENDGRIVSEISKIYDIYLTDVNGIVSKNPDNNDDILTLLSNFENYIDRKIDKFSKVSSILMDSEIEALNKVFTEDE